MKLFFRIIVVFFSLWLIGFGCFIYSSTHYIFDLRKTDAIVVLTGGKGRIAEAIDLLSKNMANYMLITGVAKSANIEEIIFLSQISSSAMTLSLKDKITLGYEATNTFENAKEASIWMNQNNFNSLRLVTSNYHMLRSMLEFKLLMPNKVIIPHPSFNNTEALKWLKSVSSIRLLFKEYHKYLLAKFVDKRLDL